MAAPAGDPSRTTRPSRTAWRGRVGAARRWPDCRGRRPVASAGNAAVAAVRTTSRRPRVSDIEFASRANLAGSHVCRALGETKPGRDQPIARDPAAGARVADSAPPRSRRRRRRTRPAEHLGGAAAVVNRTSAAPASRRPARGPRRLQPMTSCDRCDAATASLATRPVGVDDTARDRHAPALRRPAEHVEVPRRRRRLGDGPCRLPPKSECRPRQHHRRPSAIASAGSTPSPSANSPAELMIP